MVENEFVRARQADPEFQVDLFHLWLTLARYKLELLLSKTRALNSSQCRNVIAAANICITSHTTIPLLWESDYPLHPFY